ncbi:MAG: 4-hydroxy-3-methylbut-2-enyl diphosphate reductase, partial [Candidatus Latescibacterota bacterium]
MKVIVAETGGFCMGVKRAMDMILKATEENHGNNIICTYGPLIHNRQVLEMLSKKGVKVAETPEECAGKIVLVRAHGIPPDQRKKLKAVAKKLLDATCPRVARVQALIRRHARKGYLPVIVGDPEHAEVIGLMGYSEGKGIVINKVEDVEKLPEAEKVLVVAQTTQNEKTFNDIVSAIKQRYNNVEVYNTICGSTHQRQEEVKRMAEKVDAMVVVGGYHSGNTIRLAEIARQCGLPTFHVETEKELDVEKLASFDTIGVTAGASTPSWMIRRVVDVLESITHKDSAFYHHILFKSLRMMLNVNVIVSCGAGILSYVAASIAGGSRTFSLAMMSALYVFAMHTVNRYTDKASLRFREPEQVAFYEKWYIPLCVASGAAILLSLFLAYQNGKLAFFLMLLITALGLLYNVPIIRSDKNVLKHINKLKDIPGSKTLFVAGAWGAVTSIIPDLAQNTVSII